MNAHLFGKAGHHARTGYRIENCGSLCECIIIVQETGGAGIVTPLCLRMIFMECEKEDWFVAFSFPCLSKHTLLKNHCTLLVITNDYQSTNFVIIFLKFFHFIRQNSTVELTLTLLNATECTNSKKLLHWAGKAYLLVWRIQLHLAGVVFVIPPGFCYVIAEFPIAYGSCLGTLHSVAFSRVLREYPVGVLIQQMHVHYSLVNDNEISRI